MSSQLEKRVSVSESAENQRNISIEIPHGIYGKRFGELLRTTQQRAHIKGFRPGRAPLEMIAKLYGESVQSTVLRELVEEAYRDAVSEHALPVVGLPHIHIDPVLADTDLKITATVELYPKPELKDYFGVSFEVEAEEFDEAEVERGITRLREQLATTAPVEDRTIAEEGDIATVDYSATLDGEPLEGASVTDTPIELNAERIIADLVTGIVGMSVGEEREVIVRFPDTAPEERVRGKEVQYRVTLKGLARKVLPAIDDDFAGKTGLAQSVTELRQSLEEHMRKHVEENNRNKTETHLFEAIAEKNPYRLPQVIVDEEIRSMLFEGGFLNAKEEKSFQLDMAPFREHLQARAEGRARRFINLARIVEQEGVEISDDELKSWLEEKAAGQKEGSNEVEKILKSQDRVHRLKDAVAREKMTALLLEKAKVRHKKSASGRKK